MIDAHDFLTEFEIRRVEYGREQGHRIELFPGPCPLVSCLSREAHYHPLCPSCNAVSYGNSFCPSCRTAREATRPRPQAQGPPA